MFPFYNLYKIPYSRRSNAVICSALSAYVLPCYSSYDAIVKNDEAKKNRWIAYWMVLSLFECLFVVLDYFLYRYLVGKA